jgi:hypothetical protein
VIGIKSTFLKTLTAQEMGHNQISCQATDTIYMGFGEQIKAKYKRQDQGINRRLKHSEKTPQTLKENF